MVETLLNHGYGESVQELINAWGGEINSAELAEVDEDVREKIVKTAKLVEIIGGTLLDLMSLQDIAWQKAMTNFIEIPNNLIKTSEIPEKLKQRLSTFLINPLVAGCRDEETLSKHLIIKSETEDQIRFAINQAKFIINSCQN